MGRKSAPNKTEMKKIVQYFRDGDYTLKISKKICMDHRTAQKFANEGITYIKKNKQLMLSRSAWCQRSLKNQNTIGKVSIFFQQRYFH